MDDARITKNIMVAMKAAARMCKKAAKLAAKHLPKDTLDGLRTAVDALCGVFEQKMMPCGGYSGVTLWR